MPESLQRAGTCNRFCGRCCTMRSFDHPGVVAVFPGVKENGDCIHLAWKDGKAECGIYNERPELCRIFPQHPAILDVIPECSYYFIPVGEVTTHAQAV